MGYIANGNRYQDRSVDLYLVTSHQVRKEPSQLVRTLEPDVEGANVLDTDAHYMFRAVIRGSLYLEISTWPELSKLVGILAQHMRAQHRYTLPTRVAYSSI